jgi:hypothetical protein
MSTVDDLVRVLRGNPGVAAADLGQRLGISPSRLSRLVAEAGDVVGRFGQSRATRYALPRRVVDVGTEAPLFEIGEDGSPLEVGRLAFVQPAGFWLEYGDASDYRPYLPVFLKECGPSGFLGRHFSARFPELNLPGRLESWQADDYVRAAALRGEDAVGNLVIGTESMNRFLRLEPSETAEEQYPTLAEGTGASTRNTSAGGERPKFTAFRGGKHLLVKFATPGEEPEAQRWRDLLVCEHLALEVIREAGIPAARSRCLDLQGFRFLEVERFDRVGERGRIGVRSLDAVKAEAMVSLSTWTQAADVLGGGVKPLVRTEDASRIRWLEAFGGVTGNTDRHDGNLSFLRDKAGKLSLAPAYDMAPMSLAPVARGVVDSAWTPERPAPSAMAEWQRAHPVAVRFWSLVAQDRRIGPALRQRARHEQEAVQRIGTMLFPRLRGRAGPEL